MTKPIDIAKDAISALYEHIAALGVAAHEASILLRKAITDAIEEITGGSKSGSAKKRGGRPARTAAASVARATPKPKATGKARKGGKRGAKPGGRQLKAFLGVKAYDALSDDVRNKGRNVISALRDDWKTMSKKEQGDALGKAGVHAAAGGAAPAKAKKARKASRTAKPVAVAPKLEGAAS